MRPEAVLWVLLVGLVSGGYVMPICAQTPAQRQAQEEERRRQERAEEERRRWNKQQEEQLRRDRQISNDRAERWQEQELELQPWLEEQRRLRGAQDGRLPGTAPQARNPGSTNPAELTRQQYPRITSVSAMPSVERVMAEVKGAAPLDTKLRQWAAIQFLVEDLFPAGPPGNVPQSAERAALNKSYIDRMQTFHAELRQEIFGVVDVKPGQATPEQASRWKEAYGRMHTYRNSPEFQQQLVRQFFSPEWIASDKGQKAAQPGATAAAQHPSAPISTPPGASTAPPATLGAAASGGGEPSQADIQGVLAKARINHSSGQVYEIRSARKLGCRTSGDPSYLCEVEFDACSQVLDKCSKGRTTVRLARNDQGWVAMKK